MEEKTNFKSYFVAKEGFYGAMRCIWYTKKIIITKIIIKWSWILENVWKKKNGRKLIYNIAFILSGVFFSRKVFIFITFVFWNKKKSNKSYDLTL